MARGPDMRAVELVEGDAGEVDGTPADSSTGRSTGTPADGSTGTPTGSAPGPATTARRPSRALAVGAVLALMVAGVVAGQERREDARLAALADVPGMVAPIDGPLRVRWGMAEGGGQLRWLGGDVVAVVQTPRRGIAVVGLDPATGAERWRTPVSPAGRGSQPSAWCDAPDAADAGRPLLVCVVVEDTDTADAAGIGSVTYPTRARLVVLDPATGVVVRDEAVPPTTAALPLGTDVLLAHVDDDGHVRASRTDPRDGTARWTFRSPEPVAPDRLGQRPLSTQTDGELVVLHTGDTWVLDADGRTVRTWSDGPRTDPGVGGGYVELLPGRGLLVRPADDALAPWGADVVDVATGRTFGVDGQPLHLQADDGSLADVLLVQRGDGMRRTGYDVATGRELWTVPAGLGGSTLVLDGRVLGLDRYGLRSVDGRTGELVWARPVPVPDAASLVTDGRVVVVGSAGRSREGVATAYGVDDGRERWSTELGTDLYLFGVDGALLGHAPHGVVVLAPPADGG